MTLVETYRGSVNRWECDENDHQNVRFYLAKLQQGLCIALTKLGITSKDDAPQLLKSISSHHIRYLKEARIAVPQVICCGVLSFQPNVQLTLLSLMRNSSNQELLATFVSEFDLSTKGVRTHPLKADLVEAPQEALPRGVPDTANPYAGLSYGQALDAGFAQIGAGVIGSAECDAQGDIEIFNVMGRMSDGMPNLWALFQTDEELDARSSGITGGAVLEYRLCFHQPIRRGTQFAHLGGIHTLGSKTQSISHLIYDASDQSLLVSAEALGISMDLKTRKSIAIPPDRRERISAQMLRRLN